jgi:hypothetical protein
LNQSLCTLITSGKYLHEVNTEYPVPQCHNSKGCRSGGPWPKSRSPNNAESADMVSTF